MSKSVMRFGKKVAGSLFVSPVTVNANSIRTSAVTEARRWIGVTPYK